jgi:hypothetical protein
MSSNSIPKHIPDDGKSANARTELRDNASPIAYGMDIQSPCDSMDSIAEKFIALEEHSTVFSTVQFPAKYTQICRCCIWE